jgi:hypothetical protein
MSKPKEDVLDRAKRLLEDLPAHAFLNAHLHGEGWTELENVLNTGAQTSSRAWHKNIGGKDHMISIVHGATHPYWQHNIVEPAKPGDKFRSMKKQHSSYDMSPIPFQRYVSRLK